MANTVIAFPQYGFSGGQTVPILAIDNGDGTYSLGTVAYNQSYKSPVRVATTVAGTLASSFANGQTVDGIVLATGDRILIKNQAAPAANGIYIVAASGAPARATDFDSWAEIPGAVVGVLVGTTNADTAWICTSDSGGTIGSTAINFSAFGSSTDLHSPTAIGDVTPNTIAGTSVQTPLVKAPASTALAIRSSAGVDMITLPTSGSAIELAGGIKLPNDEANGIFTAAYAGNIRINGGKFNLDADGILKFAGVTASFPGIKRSATVLQARLADDSGVASYQGKLTTEANATTGLIAGALAALTNASIVIYDAAGTAYRVPCVTP